MSGRKQATECWQVSILFIIHADGLGSITVAVGIRMSAEVVAREVFIFLTSGFGPVLKDVFGLHS